MWKITCPLHLLLFLLLPVCRCTELPVCGAEKQKRHPSKGVFSPGGQIRRRPGFWSQNVKNPWLPWTGIERAPVTLCVQSSRLCTSWQFLGLGMCFTRTPACTLLDVLDMWTQAVKIFAYYFSIFMQRLSNCAIWENLEAEVARQQTLSSHDDLLRWRHL